MHARARICVLAFELMAYYKINPDGCGCGKPNKNVLNVESTSMMVPAFFSRVLSLISAVTACNVEEEKT